MKREAYAAARSASPVLYSYFACHREKALKRGLEKQIAPLPDLQTIETLVDAAFWTSLRRVEGYATKISLAFVPPDAAGSPILFERPLPLDPAALTRIAPAVERPGIHLGVWGAGGELSVWGATRTIPLLCFVAEVSAPGLIVVKHHNGEQTRKFINVAVLEGDQIKMVDQRISERSDSPQLLRSLLEFDTPVSGAQSIITLARLAISMRKHGRGGTLLIVPADSDCWRESVLQPISYGVAPAAAQPNGHGAELDEQAISTIGGLTAVDGAAVIDSRYRLLGFGAKIMRQQASPRAEQVLLSEPIHGSTPFLIHLDQLGGTRHLSAAQFVHDQRDSAALVASQDGHFTVFEWSPEDAMVHAHRLETLLL